MKTWAIVVAALAALVTTTVAGRADALEVGFKGMFAFGGEASIEDQGAEADDDMEATAGFGLYGTYGLFRYLDIGAQVAFLWYETEAMDDNDQDANTAIDIGALVKPKFPLLGGKLDIYVAVPIGLSIFVPSSDTDDVIKTGVGMHVGVLPGVAYRFWKGLGAFAELGWSFHLGKHDKKGGGDYEYSFSQFALNLGVSYEF